MRKILNLIKCEFIKNYNFPKVLLVLVVLMVSVIVVSESSVTYDYRVKENPKQEIEILEQNYQSFLEEDSIDALEKEFRLNRIEKLIELNKELEKLGEVYRSSWQSDVVSVISNLENELFIVKQMQENPNKEFKVEEATGEIAYIDPYNEAITTVKGFSKVKSLKELEIDYQKEIDTYKEILKENKFYKYIEYRLKKFEENGIEDSHFTNPSIRLDYQITEENKKEYEYIISEKIEKENDSRVLNFIQLQKTSEKYEVLSLEDWKVENEGASVKDYEGYVRYREAENKIIEKEKVIISYSLHHQKKHDLMLKYQQGMVGNGYYHNTKSAVNQVLHLAIIVLFLAILTSCGIVSQEHTAKTEKSLLTSPIKRYKVFFSKFLYLILHTYIIWFVAFILIFLYSGIRFGFNDLFTSKLVYFDGKVIEVNYIFYMIKTILINGIPVIAILSILMLLSTITLNTATTVGIGAFLAILSCWLWQLIVQLRIFFLVYTPFPYMNLYSLQEGNSFFLATLESIKTSQGLGLLVSVITIIVCYVLANIVYVKRDVKN